MAAENREDALIQRVRRITDIAQEPLEFLLAITGYEEKPIVSIDEAVKPLVTIVPVIENQTYIAKMRCRNPANGLTQDEATSIMLYTMEWEPSCLYTLLNATLRMKDRKKLKPWFLYMKLFFIALDRLPSTTGRFLFRGVKFDLSNQYKLGETFVWWGFSSCTVSMGVLQSEHFLGQTGKRTMFTIECDSGKDIRKHSYLHEEDEALILPATQFEVIGYLQPAPDLHMIHLKEVQPPASLRAVVSPPVSPPPPNPIPLPSPNPSPVEPPTAINPQTDSSTADPDIVGESATTPSVATICNNTRLINTIKKLQTDPTLTQINISSHGIDDEGAKHLSDALRNNQTITQLDLRYNQISAEGAKYLADALRNNQTITQLNLSLNGAEGTKYVADALRNNRTITQLNLECNQIGAEGAKYLADALRNSQTITQLNLEDNQIEDEGAKYLADALRNSQTITQLNLGNNQIGDEGAKYLADALRNNQTITQLNLSSNKIGVEGTKYLADALRNNQTITQLDLRLNEIGDEGAKYLADALRNNQTITQLNLGNNQIGDEGAKYLADALRNNQAITQLNLGCNQIGDEGAKYLADALRNNQTLSKLSLAYNEIGVEGEKLLNEAAKRESSRPALDVALCGQEPGTQFESGGELQYRRGGFFQRVVKFFGRT